MRRFFVVLASVLLLVVLAPSAASGAPPDFQIKGITVVARGPDSPGCLVDVTVTFRAVEFDADTVIQFVQAVDENVPGDSTPVKYVASASPVTVGNAEGNAFGGRDRYEITQTFREVGLNDPGTHWHWGAQLFDHWVDYQVGVEGPLSKLELTGEYIGTGSCPAAGTILASN